MIKNNVWYEFFASYTVPNHDEVGYWIDLGANSKGKVIKVYNQDIKTWVKLTDATSEDAVSPFIGSNGNWWVDNRDTGIPAAGKNPYIDKDTFTWWIYDSINGKYIDTGVVPEGKSAYILAVEHGFTGTEEEWLASLKKPAEDAAVAALDAANKANEAAEKSNSAADRANEAADEAEDAANRANELANNPPKIVDNTWYIYNETTKEYESTDIKANRAIDIVKTYGSIVEMENDYNTTDVKVGEFVIIDSNVEDEDNSKLYLKGNDSWVFISDLSGARGISGQSAYQLAVQQGFVGTEEEWIQSLKQPALDAAEEALDAKAEVLATEADIKAAEALRVAAENDRVTAENTRSDNEQARVTAESARVTAEESRVSAESSRVEAEKARVANEAGRAQNEADRVNNEQLRIADEDARDKNEIERQSNENVRKSSEEVRVTNENARVSAETARDEAETNRTTAEDERVAAEAIRVSNEADRQANEAIRETQETARETNTTQAINAVNEAKTAAETATTNATTAASNANTQAANAKEIADNPPKIENNYWYVYDTTTKDYVNTNVSALGSPGKSPKIVDGTWWVFDDDANDYVNTTVSVSSNYELTKAKVENVLTGEITSHTHDTMYIGDAPVDTKQYVRQDGAWTEVDIKDVTIITDTELSNTSENPVQNKAITAGFEYVLNTIESLPGKEELVDIINETVDPKLDTKVTIVEGKGLSTNDYTTDEKTKLAGIAAGAEVNVNADWNATSGDAQILNKPTLATVATSGSYNDLSNKPTIITEAEVDQKISTAVGAVYKVKGSVANYASLPTENVSIGDVYNLEDTGANYVATSTTPDWDKLSETVDLSGYLTKSDAANTYQPKGDYLTSVPDEYVTDTELNTKLQDYSTTGEINSALQSLAQEVEDTMDAALATKLDSSAYTAADVLSKVKTVDGEGSGLDADLLDGKHGSEYALKTDIPDLITVDSELSETSENPVQNKVISAKITELNESTTNAITNVTNMINDIDEVWVSEGVTPDKDQEVWIDLSDNSFDELAVEEAPKDGKQYARKNGQWVVVESAPLGETVKITVTSNQAQPDADINGVTITLVYGNNTKEFTWEGTEITTEVPMNMSYTITCSEVEGYATPEVQEYIALASNTRNISLSYNTTITTINVTSNHPTLFAIEADVTLNGGFQKSLTGALTYTVKIPTNVEYTVTCDYLYIPFGEYRRYDAPEVQTVTATGATQSINLVHYGAKVTLNVTSDQGGSFSVNISSISNTIGFLVSPGTTASKEFIFGIGTYSFMGVEKSGFITPSTQSITIDSTYEDKTVTLAYSSLTEENYAMWVEFDDTTSTTTLNRGGNLDVITSLTSKFKRCLALPQNNGTAAITYLDPTNSGYFEEGGTVTGVPASHYMVHFPKYYYRSEEVATNKWRLYISERKINSDYKEERECLIGAFEASIYNDSCLTSKPYVSSTGSQTITTFFNQAQANGSNWGLIDYRAHKTIANLFCAKYGNTDISTSNSSIPCSGGNKDYSTGNTGGTISLGDADGRAVVYNDSSHYSTNFLGLEDCYYSKTEFVQGINIISKKWVVYDGGLKVDTAAAGLQSAGYTNVREIGTAGSSDGYIKSLTHGEYADVMPTAVGGSSTTYYADYYYQGTSNKVFRRSGSSDRGSYCGVFGSYASYASAASRSYIGSRLGFYGDIVIKTKDEFLALSPGYNG